MKINQKTNATNVMVNAKLAKTKVLIAYHVLMDYIYIKINVPLTALTNIIQIDY